MLPLGVSERDPQREIGEIVRVPDIANSSRYCESRRRCSCVHLFIANTLIDTDSIFDEVRFQSLLESNLFELAWPHLKRHAHHRRVMLPKLKHLADDLSLWRSSVLLDICALHTASNRICTASVLISPAPDARWADPFVTSRIKTASSSS